MPNTPAHTCPSCGRVVLGVCQRCLRVRDQRRGSAHERGYTIAWTQYSRRWLARFPWCGMRADGQLHPEHSRCAQHGQRTRATVTDHIVAMKAGGRSMDDSNHQSLCGGCNRRKAMALEGALAK